MIRNPGCWAVVQDNGVSYHFSEQIATDVWSAQPSELHARIEHLPEWPAARETGGRHGD